MSEQFRNYIPRIGAEEEPEAAVEAQENSATTSGDEGDELDFYYYPPELQITNPGVGAQIEAMQSAMEFSAFISYQDEFEANMSDLGLRYFKAHEFLFLGGGHYSNGPCSGLNALPPKSLWPSIRQIAKAIDEIRHRLGAPIIMSSIYRNTSYNNCIGGVPNSFHKQFKAIDFRCLDGNGPPTWAAVAREVRSEDLFIGGVGTYNTFVHIDNRGNNVDF